MHLAFKFVAITLMLGEAKFFSETCGLPTESPIVAANVQAGSHVGTPSTNDFTGSVITEKYFYGFGWGHLANFYRKDFRPSSDAAVKARNVFLSKEVSLIDTNSARLLALSYLGKLGIDVASLEQKYKPSIFQWKYLPQGIGEKSIPLPIFQAEWHGKSPYSKRQISNAVIVSITLLGTTKEMLELHVLDDSLFVRPRLEIVGLEKLLAISDDEFSTYDEIQRSNLVFRFDQKTTVQPSARRNSNESKE